MCDKSDTLVVFSRIELMPGQRWTHACAMSKFVSNRQRRETARTGASVNARGMWDLLRERVPAVRKFL